MHSTRHGKPEMTPSPLVSIITVVRNDAERLLRTVTGVAGLKGAGTEYIVVDGNSSDGTLAIIQDHPHVIDRYISEPDKGIYDAMNKGIALARGRYLLFLNAGDELLADVEQIVAMHPDSPVLLYGRANMIAPNGTLRYVKGKQLKNIRRFLKGMPLCHQAILYRRDVMPHYDLRFKVISDRVLTYLLVREHTLANTRFIDRVLVNYYEDGFSGNYPYRLLREEENLFYRSVGKSQYVVIKSINTLFKYKIKYPFVRLFRTLSSATPEKKTSN
jgi:glycosyltransferase involved in cell wall biosynthesis